jgi:hypothetical protein
VGGAALAAGGYQLLVVSLAALFALGTVPHVTAILSRTRNRRRKSSSPLARLRLDPDRA